MIPEQYTFDPLYNPDRPTPKKVPAVKLMNPAAILIPEYDPERIHRLGDDDVEVRVFPAKPGSKKMLGLGYVSGLCFAVLGS